MSPDVTTDRAGRGPGAGAGRESRTPLASVVNPTGRSWPGRTISTWKWSMVTVAGASVLGVGVVVMTPVWTPAGGNASRENALTETFS